MCQSRWQDPARSGLSSEWAVAFPASGGASAGIGQTIFGVILVLQTLLTLLLAPALTSGALSMEREKQTLELLITTPVSTLGLVVGKLVSSLAYVVILVLASIPLMSVVRATSFGHASSLRSSSSAAP